ncbi:MAG: hypothetical protein AAF066_13220 [Pseudomonadota bacterium]
MSSVSAKSSYLTPRTKASPIGKNQGSNMAKHLIIATIAATTVVFFAAQNATAQASSKGIFGYNGAAQAIDERASSKSESKKAEKKRKKVKKPRKTRGSFY